MLYLSARYFFSHLNISKFGSFFFARKEERRKEGRERRKGRKDKERGKRGKRKGKEKEGRGRINLNFQNLLHSPY